MSDTDGKHRVRRSLLFVPGARPDRFAGAESSGADIVCVDLEDAVSPAEKATARDAALAWLQAPRGRAERALRINPLPGASGEADLGALAESGVAPDILLLPKVESAEAVQLACIALSANAVGIVPMIESPSGLLRALDIAGSSPAVTALMFGGADFAAALRAEMSWESLLYARGQLAVIAAAVGVDLIDVPCLAFKDETLLAEETRRVIAMGFTTKSAIHPVQIPTIHQQFSPSEDAVAQARRIVAADNESGGGVAAVDGQMIDRPVVLAAERTLALAALDAN